MTGNSIVALEGVDLGYGRRAVLRDVNLRIDEGEMVAVVGSSGSGKSTLLNILGILDDYDEGSYRLDGTLMRDLSERQAAVYRNQFIGFVFQSFNLLPLKTAVENVELPLQYRGVPRRKRMAAAFEALEKVGLGHRAEHLPSEMSGGEKQRVAIARALVTGPRLILADEPTGALDTTTSVQIMELLETANRDGVTLLIVTHEPDIAARCQRLIRIRDGRIATDDTGSSGSHPAAPGPA